jgi:uncharacterized repeat protein (TIGR01451 family)
MTVILVAALFLGTAASAGITTGSVATKVERSTTKTINPSSLSALGNQPTGDYNPAPATPKGDRAFLINEGFEGTWVQSSDPDDPIPYYVPVDPNFGEWDIDGLCVASQSGYPALTHYWSQYNNDLYPLAHSGDYCAGMWWSDGSGGDYVQNEWLKTPVMDLSAYPAGLEMSTWGVYSWYYASAYGDHMNIEITDGTTGWYTIIDMAAQELGGAGYGGYGWNWNEVPIVADLSQAITDFGLNAANIQVAWHVYNDYGGTVMAIFMVDDITITVPSASIHVEKQIYVEVAGGGPAEYTLGLEDTWGDGWNGGYLDVYVNGVAIYLGLTLAYGTGPEYHTIAVADGDVIFIDYTYYWYAYENIWYLNDQDGNQLFIEYGSYDNNIHDQTVTVSLGGGAAVDYTLGLYDSYGDGWNGGYLDVYVNGIAIYTGLTITYGYGPEYYTIAALVDGDIIFIDYTPGSWTSENEWWLLDEDGEELFYEYGSNDYNANDQTVTVSIPVGIWVDADTPEEAVDWQICTVVQFKITVTNDGDYPIYAIYLYDAWDSSMEFVDAAPYPSYWGYGYAYWWDPQIPYQLMPGESIEILVWMHVLGPHCSIDANWAYAWANSDYEPYYVDDDDYAYIHCVDEYHIDVQKYVRTRSAAAEWTITLEDAYGDGWNGGFLDIYVNGVAVYTGLTLPNGYGPESHPIAITDLDELIVDYTYGSWAYENIWYLTDSNGNQVFYEEGGYDNNAYDHTLIAEVGEWVEIENYAQGDTAMFKISITNDGMQPLTDIDVYDTMSDSLQFVNADPYPDDVPPRNAPVPPSAPATELNGQPEIMVKDNNPQQLPPSNTVLWDNGMIWGEMLVACQYEPSYGELGTAADDFQFGATTDVNDVEWIGGYYNGDPNYFDWQIWFYNDDGTGTKPGTVFAGPYYFLNADCNEQDLGAGYFSYSVELPATVTFAGGVKYWVAFQGQGIYPPQSGIALHWDYTILHEAVWKSAFFGFPDWVDASYMWGDVMDISFTLTFEQPPEYTLYWNFPGPLAPGESIDILVWAAVVGDIGETDINSVTVETAEGVSGYNDAFVNIVDLIPPVTTHEFSGTMGANDWYVSDVTITLTATDDYSGIAYTMISLDGAAFEQYTGAIVVSEAGDHDISYYSVDNYGNVEATKGPFDFKIDQTPPVTTHTIAGTMGLDSWYVSDVTITLAATDGTSGVDQTFYKIDTGAWTVYAGPVVVSTDGQHQFYYNSTDKAGNQEATNGPFAFKMDKTAPDWISYNCTPLNLLKTKWLLAADVTDATSGIVMVEFYVDDALVGNDTTAPYEFEYQGTIAMNNSQAIAYDAAGNSAMGPLVHSTEFIVIQQQYTQSQQTLQSLKLKLV